MIIKLFRQICLILLFTGNLHAVDSKALSSTDGTQHSRKLTKNQLNRLLEQTEKEFGKIQSLSADFVQNKHLSIFTETIKSGGHFFFKSPGMIRFEITEPFKSVLIVNDGRVGKYEFVDGKWVKLNSGGQEMILVVMENITSWLKGRFRDQENIYTISAVEHKNTKELQSNIAKQIITIILTPKDKRFRKYINSIELGMADDKKGLNHIIIRESGMDYTKIDFINEKRNIAFPAKVFEDCRFEPYNP